MKRKLLYSIVIFGIIGISIPTIQSYPTGAPSDGRTGSPGDEGKTCVTSGCHSGGPTDATGIITSNIPAEGYTPGTSYTITVTVDGSGKKGLCVSPQKTDGTVMGALTAGMGNQVTGAGYITHTSAISTAIAVWTFTWVAPVKGSGSVGFYGAFANNRNTVRKTLVTVNEKVASGVNENNALTHLSLYPNPASHSLNIGFDLKKAGKVRITLIDITGKEISTLNEGNFSMGVFEEAFTLPTLNSGIYFIAIHVNDEVLNRKILVQQ